VSERLTPDREAARAEVSTLAAVLRLEPALADHPERHRHLALATAFAPRDRPDLLTWHPFDAATVHALLAPDAAESVGFASLPEALRAPLDVAALSHFVAMTGAGTAYKRWRAISMALAFARPDAPDRPALARALSEACLALALPKLPGRTTRGPIHDLEVSLRCFSALAEARSRIASNAAVLSFAPPYSLWTARPDARDTVDFRAPGYGKWNVHVPGRESGAAVLGRLLPAVEAGEVALAKSLLHDLAVGGSFVVAYAVGQDPGVKAALEEAAGKRAWFVGEGDCAEAAGLAAVLREGAALLDRESDLDRCLRWSPGTTPALGPEFGLTVGLSDVQRELLAAALRGGVCPAPVDRTTDLVGSYLFDLGEAVCRVAPALEDEAFSAALATIVAPRLQRERRTAAAT